MKRLFLITVIIFSAIISMIAQERKVTAKSYFAKPYVPLTEQTSNQISEKDVAMISEAEKRINQVFEEYSSSQSHPEASSEEDEFEEISSDAEEKEEDDDDEPMSEEDIAAAKRYEEILKQARERKIKRVPSFVDDGYGNPVPGSWKYPDSTEVAETPVEKSEPVAAPVPAPIPAPEPEKVLADIMEDLDAPYEDASVYTDSVAEQVFDESLLPDHPEPAVKKRNLTPREVVMQKRAARNSQYLRRTADGKMPEGVYIMDVDNEFTEWHEWEKGSTRPAAIALISKKIKVLIALHDASYKKVIWGPTGAVNEIMLTLPNHSNRELGEEWADMNGEKNTDLLVEYLNPRQSSALWLAGNYIFPDKDETRGYLPAIGEFFEVYDHIEDVNDALLKAGGDVLRDEWYWTSTQHYLDYRMWAFGGFDSEGNRWFAQLRNGDNIYAERYGIFRAWVRAFGRMPEVEMVKDATYDYSYEDYLDQRIYGEDFEY